MTRPVVVSGLGTAGAYGCGAAALAAALASGAAPATVEVDRAAGYHRRAGAHRALLTPLASLHPWVPPIEARRMSPPSRMAVAAMRMAIAGAGLAAADLAGPRTAVVMATAFGPSSFSEALLRQILLEGPDAASPYLFTESVANAPAAQIALACHAQGASITLCQREAGALLALARGAAEVAGGRADRALVGTVDEISPLVHALLDRYGALAHPAETGRPFDRRRCGIVAADGATVLVVESEEAAARRGQAPLARVLAWGSAFDPSAGAVGWGSGAGGLVRAVRRLLARVPVAVDRVASGASGSRGGDLLEARMLRALWDGGAVPPTLAPKAVTGEYGGGFLAAVVAAAGGAPVAPAAGGFEVDPELGVAPHAGGALPPPAALLATSLAVGGAAAWLVLGRP